MTDTDKRVRPQAYHGTANQAIEWALNVNSSGQSEEFLSAWQLGNLGEWPEFYRWLAEQEGSLVRAIFLDDGDAIQRLYDGTAGQLDLTSCGTSFLAAERCLRIVERYGWPAQLDMLEWLSAEAAQAGSGFNLRASSEREFDDPVPF